MSDSESSSAPEFLRHSNDSVAEPLLRRSTFWRTALLLYVAFLVVRAARLRQSAEEPLGWALQSSADVIDWLRSLAWLELANFASFLVLGLLIPPALASGAHRAARPGAWGRRMNWLGLGACAAIAIAWITWGEFPRLGALAVPLVGYLVGLRLSSAWLRGTRSFAWATAQLALALVLVVAAVAGLARLALEQAPLDFEPTQLTDADKHRLAQWIRASRPAEGEPRRLRLTDIEVESILNALVGRGRAQRKAQVRFQPGSFDTAFSLVLPQRLADQTFLNARLAGEVAIDAGDLRMHFSRLEVGRLVVPPLLLGAISPAAKGLLLDDPRLGRIVGAIASMRPETGAIETVFEPGALGRRVVPSLAQLLWQRPDVAHQTEIYIRALVERFNALPADSDRFGLLMQSAFALAAERSREYDPALENRAAIFALAILMGHQGLEPFVGEVEDTRLRADAAPLMDATMLRGRHDWVRHFLVSAALALLANEAASDRIGLLKEQLDSQDGGSGFSFGDLLADRAGTRFALAATRDGASAVAMQARLAAGFNVGEFFPPAEDLPEGISDADFQSQYGGIHGQGYRALSDEIDRRLARLPPM